MAGPRWVRLDVDYFHNPKALAAGRDGRDLHLASICWSGRYLTDGLLPSDSLAALASDAGLTPRWTARAVEAVVAAGLWLPTDGKDFYLKDFTEMNGTKADVERERDRWRLRQRESRSRRSHGETNA